MFYLCVYMWEAAYIVQVCYSDVDSNFDAIAGFRLKKRQINLKPLPYLYDAAQHQHQRHSAKIVPVRLCTA